MPVNIARPFWKEQERFPGIIIHCLSIPHECAALDLLKNLALFRFHKGSGVFRKERCSPEPRDLYRPFQILFHLDCFLRNGKRKVATTADETPMKGAYNTPHCMA
jgi:hypothetical protein